MPWPMGEGLRRVRTDRGRHAIILNLHPIGAPVKCARQGGAVVTYHCFASALKSLPAVRFKVSYCISLQHGKQCTRDTSRAA